MADLIPYPQENFNSYASVEEAEIFFETRLNTSAFSSAPFQVKEAALMTGFQSLRELDLDIDLETDPSPLETFKHAQFEQALWELNNDTDTPTISALNLMGISIKKSPNPPPRISPRVMALLKPYISMKTITRTR
jgi:hypothetical protein